MMLTLYRTWDRYYDFYVVKEEIMDTVIKGFLGVFIFAMIVYLSAGLISAEMDTHAARSYMDSAKKGAESYVPNPDHCHYRNRQQEMDIRCRSQHMEMFRDRWRRT